MVAQDLAEPCLEHAGLARVPGAYALDSPPKLAHDEDAQVDLLLRDTPNHTTTLGFARRPLRSSETTFVSRRSSQADRPRLLPVAGEI